MMRYKFVAAYCAYGMGMTPDQEDVTLFQDGGIHVYLTQDATRPLTLIDRQLVLANLLLSGIFGMPTDVDRDVARANKLAEIIEERGIKYKNYGFLIVEIDGSVEVVLPENCINVDDFRVCMHAYDKAALSSALQPNVVSAISAVRMAGDTDYQFELVNQGSVLFDGDGKVVHSLNISGGSAEIIAGRALNASQIAVMHELIVPLRQSPELEQAIDLYAQSLNHRENKLRAFMAAWNALELFVMRVKERYGPLWMSDVDNPITTGGRLAELNSIPANNSRVERAFGKIACYLSDGKQESDITEFTELRNIRNDLSHELKDKNLPADRVRTLFDKYLKAHLRHLSADYQGQ
ncbi:hypothetical protein ACO0LO_01820 [Undibacterium sp. TJN25]|uniref:hypothetical protein n=1 Tax=Undibacterium sp. TJN25 TaxID=3413056 RepID=UPI003BF45567